MLQNNINSSQNVKSMNLSKMDSFNNTGRQLKTILENKKNKIKGPDLGKKDNRVIPKVDAPRF